MGRCRSVLRIITYILIPLTAILVYLHYQCLNEQQEKEANRFNKYYKPDDTDITDYPLRFVTRGTVAETYLPRVWLLMQWYPCCLLKFLSPFIGKRPNYIAEDAPNTERHNVTFHDARKESPGVFNETGFALIELESEPGTSDWRSNFIQYENADVTKFHRQMEPHLRRLYPGVKRFKWMNNVIRGGNKAGDQPAAIDIPHLDYNQNKTARIAFHKEFPILEIGRLKLNVEGHALLGESDGEGDLGVMLGVWKPILPGKKVCDHPLAVMDARTFKQEDENPNRLRMAIPVLSFFGYYFDNLQGAISYDAEQRWYYWPFQSTREVLVFHQYSEGRFWANPHTSFHNKNCPPDPDTRLSAELRVVLYF